MPRNTRRNKSRKNQHGGMTAAQKRAAAARQRSFDTRAREEMRLATVAAPTTTAAFVANAAVAANTAANAAAAANVAASTAVNAAVVANANAAVAANAATGAPMMPMVPQATSAKSPGFFARFNPFAKKTRRN